MAAGPLMPSVRGKPTIPVLDYESAFVNSNTPAVVGNGNATTLHALTIGSSGVSWVIDVWRVSGATSAGTSISPATQGTFGYDIYGPNGFIINPKAGTPGQLVVIFREH